MRERARRAGRAMLWSPPRVRSFGKGLVGWRRAGGREPSSRKAAVIWMRARALSKGVKGMSPQSRIVKADV